MKKYRKYLGFASLCCTLILMSSLLVPSYASLSNSQRGSEILDQQLANGGSSRRSNWPAALILDSISGSGVGIKEGVNLPVRASRGQTIAYNRTLNIRAGTSNGANLRFLTRSGAVPNYLASAGRHPSRSSEYYFPCGAAHRFVIGWRSGRRGGCDPVSFSPGRVLRVGPTAGSQDTMALASSAGKQVYDPRWVAPVNLRHYCSAIADSGNQWGASLSERSWSEAEVEAVCQQAVETCEAAGDQECFIANRGDWRRYHPKPLFRNVDLLLQCEEGKEYHSKVSDLEVNAGWQQLEQEARSDQASACVLYMYYFDEVLISPSTEGRTLIYTDSSNSGFVINDLLGSVEITITDPSETSLQTVSLQAGERYVANYQAGSVNVETIPPDERVEIASSPTVGAFLDEAQWNEDVQEDIEAYDKALQDEFLPELPAVEVEEQTVAGVRVVVAAVDLSNPNTILTIAREEDVRSAGGLRPFAQRRNAALVLSGTFEDPNNSNWTTISEGRFLEGQQSRNWSNYTVLGLQRSNQPEMLARNQGPNWDAYWFALTGHPRLVSGGVPGVTEVAQGASLNLNSAAGRAAIGFSQSPNKLYHVITIDPISLPKMAEVMRTIGCDEAMNLEGGGGYFIVNQTQVYGPGQVRAPVIVVNDAENPPAAAIQQAWQNF